MIEGRLANPRRADEMVMSADAAQLLHLRVGDVVHFGIYTNAQTLENGYGTAALKPRLRIGVKLVGIVKFHFEIVRDDFDHGLRFVLLSPALTRPLERCCAATPIAGLHSTTAAATTPRSRPRSSRSFELVGDPDHGGRRSDGRAGHRAGIRRTRRVRRDRRAGGDPHRRSGDRSPASRRLRRPRHVARARRESRHDNGRRVDRCRRRGRGRRAARGRGRRRVVAAVSSRSGACLCIRGSRSTGPCSAPASPP